VSRLGFLLRCQPTGKKLFYYRYRFNGVGKFLSLGSAAELFVAETRYLASEAAS